MRSEKAMLNALEQCAKTSECAGCPYDDYAVCKSVLVRDVWKYVNKQNKKIEELEERIKTEGGK